MAFSPDGTLLLVVDVRGGAILVNYTKRILLTTIRLKDKSHAMKFSPNGQYFAVTCSNYVDVSILLFFLGRAEPLMRTNTE
jgi:periodic tryptophan protein 2